MTIYIYLPIEIPRPMHLHLLVLWKSCWRLFV